MEKRPLPAQGCAGPPPARRLGKSVRFVRRTACALFGHFEKARHSTLRRAGKEPSACPQPHRAAVPAGPASYTAVGPAPRRDALRRSERRAARQAFPAGQAKRRLSGVGRADCAVFNGPVALHKDMAQEGRHASRCSLRAGPALPGRPAPVQRGAPPGRHSRPGRQNAAFQAWAARIALCSTGL